MINENDYTCNVVLIGEKDGGKHNIKSALNERPVIPQLSQDNILSRKTIKINENQSIQFEVGESISTELYASLNRGLYKIANVCILVYDITKKSSFDRLKNHWIKEIKENARKNISNSLKNIIFIN